MTGKRSALALGLAQLLMFGGIGLLQVSPGRFFVPLLLAMHLGILVFATVKRGLSGKRPEIARIARATYLMMSLYLPLLIYKLADRLGLLHADDPLLHSATLGLSALAGLVVVYSLRAMRVRAEI